MNTDNKIQLDASKLYGFKIVAQSREEDGKQFLSSSQIGHKIGGGKGLGVHLVSTRIGHQTGIKVEAGFFSTKIGHKIGFKGQPNKH